MRLAITAGFNRSPAALALCELLRREGHQIACVIVVTPFTIKRIRSLIMQRGIGFVRSGLRKLTGHPINKHSDQFKNFLVSEKITERSLKDWSQKYKVPFASVKDINEEPAITHLNTAVADAVIYGGGGILRKSFITAAKRSIINPHCGPLPEIRGMNAIEWAVLLQQEPAITIHYIDEGIDTGDIIERQPIRLIKSESIDSLRTRAVISGICALVKQLKSSHSLEQLPRIRATNRNPGRQCYTMAPVLKDLLQYRLNQL